MQDKMYGYNVKKIEDKMKKRKVWQLKAIKNDKK